MILVDVFFVIISSIFPSRFIPATHVSFDNIWDGVDFRPDISPWIYMYMSIWNLNLPPITINDRGVDVEWGGNVRDNEYRISTHNPHGTRKWRWRWIRLSFLITFARSINSTFWTFDSLAFPGGWRTDI